MKKFILLLFLPFLLFAESKPLKVVYISHAQPSHPFVKLVNTFANAAAKDLNIDLEIVSPKENLNRYSYAHFAKRYFFAKDKPDVIIAILFRKSGKKILEYSQKSGVPVFIVNTNIADDEEAYIGEPRGKYKNFLGVLAASEKQAGALLANSLIKQIKQTNDEIEVVGISGPREAYEAIERERGLKSSAKENSIVKLHQIVHADWRGDIAYKQTLRLLDRYPSLDVLWTASDGMAIGAKKAIVEKNRDIVVGGIDWSKEGIKAVKDGYIDATVGGHFMNGGIALILLYDYFQGIDFKKELGLEINLDMSKLTSENIREYKQNFSPSSWEKIDFKKYSKFYNQNLEKYNFTLDSFMKSIPK